MLGEMVKAVGDRRLGGLNSRLAGVGVRPGTARVAEIVGACACGACFALGLEALGLALLLVHGFFDYLDGALKRAGAREQVLAARQAEVAHAVTDKVAEVAIFVGTGLGGWAQWWAVVAALVTSLLATVSGFCWSGPGGVRRGACFFDRTDRVFLFLLSVAAGRVTAGLTAIAVINCAIVGERMVKALRR